MKSPQVSRSVTLLLVAAGFAVMFASTAVKGVYQVYFVQLATHFGQGRAQFAWSGALFMLATGLMSPVVGALSDRVGPLRTSAAGALAAGLAYTSAALWNQSLVWFSLAFGLVGAFGLAAMTFVPMGVLVDRLFERAGKAWPMPSSPTAPQLASSCCRRSGSGCSHRPRGRRCSVRSA